MDYTININYSQSISFLNLDDNSFSEEKTFKQRTAKKPRTVKTLENDGSKRCEMIKGIALSSRSKKILIIRYD